jgi:hypothetical protein
MASEVGICNLALSHIGSSATISSLTADKSEEAFHCNLLYADSRDALLRAHQWGFAKRHLALSDVGSPPGNWSYRYSYPNDALYAREILQTDTAGDPIKFEIALNDAYNSRVILTDQEDAVLVYTYKVTNPLTFDSLFVNALSWRIAADIAMPLTRDHDRMLSAYQMYQVAINEAHAFNANESADDINREASWINGRA